MTPKIGFIGLGTMGLPMAKNLIKAGFDLTVYARRPEPAAEVRALGARSADSPRAVAEQVEVVITIVTADPDVRAVILGENGALAGMKAGGVIVDMSTISPMTIQEIARIAETKGVEVMDAPVSGGDTGAKAGTLTIIAGGKKGTFERCRPLFEAMGKNIFHVGGVGVGQVVKIANQVIGGTILAVVSEALVMGVKAGADPEVLRQVIGVSSGNSNLFQARVGDFMLKDQFQPGFMLDLMKKDIGLALEIGKALSVPMPVGAAAYQHYAAGTSMGVGREDFSAVCKAVEKMAGARIVPRKNG
ncbi:NAD(P)-dependent oxidoreductase [bacterium]|nr:NAD(P)-dependent oxidoreductase [bacterium]